VQNEIPFYKKQQRMIIKRCGVVDPENIEEYISISGYKATKKACTETINKEICDVVLAAVLRGRVGAGLLPVESEI
jgi:NADH:ubiquinone oxidoreductase subunit F (NADH-binding)